MLASTPSNQRVPLLAVLLLILTLLQASSFTLSIAFRGPLASDTLISLITIIWLAMYAWTVVGLFVSFGINWITWLVRYRLLLICVLAGTVFSITWSVDAALSAERSVHLIGTTLVALYIGYSLPLKNILQTSAVVLGFIMFTSVLIVMLVPELGLEEYQGSLVWRGTMASKNTLGFWAAITILLSSSLSFWSIPTEQRVLYVVITALAALCLYNSVSATSLLALVSGGLIMLYLHITYTLRLNMFAMIFLGALVASMLAVAFVFIDTAELIGRSGDLTGRGEVWAQTWKLILERPLTGYGYGTLWYPTKDTLWIQESLTDLSWTVYHAHNGLLQVASEIGLPLTALVLLMIIQQLVEIVCYQYQRQQPGVLFVLGYCIALLVSNYSEARLLVNRDLYWVLFIALPVSMLRQESMLKTHIQFNTATAHAAVRDAMKRRQTRERKAQKLSIKGRMKQRNRLKVINPGQSTATESDTQNQASEKHQQYQSGTQQTHDQHAAQGANRAKLLRLKKNRRVKKTG